MSCETCSGCSSCAGCRELVLSPEEASLLRRFAETPFLPIARRPDMEEPAFREEPGDRPETLLLLERKGLVTLDWDIPLSNYDYERLYPGLRLHGSAALTARGQRAADLLEETLKEEKAAGV